MDIAPDPEAVHQPGAAALPVIDAAHPHVPQAAAAEADAPAPNNNPAQSGTDCTCWPHSQTGLVPPQPLDQLLPEVWKPLGQAIGSFNETVKLIRAHQSQIADQSLLDSSKNAVRVQLVGITVTSSLAVAMMSVFQAPGYLLPKPGCDNSFEQHLECLTRRDETLRTYEETLKNAMVEAQPRLAEVHEKFLKQEAERRRQKAVHRTVRAAAVVSLPFAPVVSAALTAIDVLGIAVYIGVQEVLFPWDDLRPLLTSTLTLQKTLQEKVAEAQGFRRELVEIRERVEWQRNDPSASRLSVLQRTLYNAFEVSKAAPLGPGKDSPTPTRSLREVADAMREVIRAAGDPPEGTESLVGVDEAEWRSLEDTITELRAVPLAAPPS